VQLHGIEPPARRDVLLGLTVERAVPPYFDFLIEGFRRGEVGRFVHLGHWDSAPEAGGPGEFARAQEKLNAVLLELAGLRNGQDILDVGCGFGGTLQAIDRAHARMRLTGVNIDLRQLELCAQIEPADGNRMEWKQADACRLPFPDRSFDRVLCIEAMFHFDSRRAFFSEAARVLRPGGRLVASDIALADPAGNSGAPRFAPGAALRDGYGPWPDLWGEDADHRALAAAAGLDCTACVDATSNTLPSHRFTCPASLDERADPGDPALRAALMLKWLHQKGYLRYWYMTFDKADSHAARSV
jgi:SAM-dependent methyltransferase